MRRFPRPKILVSACLEFERVRYDGKIMPCPIVRELKPFVDFIMVCPEYEIGLGVPRESMRIVRAGGRERLIQPRTGRDVTDLMDNFTERFLSALPPVDGFICKSGSPTVGFYNIKVYDYAFGPGVAGRTSGVFARKILQRYPYYPVEDDRRLTNPRIRDDFLTRLFAFAGWREAAASGDPGLVRQFHERNRCLFMCYGSDADDLLGEALARADYDEYFSRMKRLLCQPRAPGRYADMAMSIFNRYSDRLSPKENEWFRALVAKFWLNRISRDGLLEAVEELAVRMSDWRVTGQTLFAPYPPELVPEADPDRGLDSREMAHPH